ncbi:uncharacterized protein [Sagmatias obliquidens]|uniref:uncharacterized protein isoform X2 n=1 Tax=Sagmatias obliquidens TaxID=3371155 RepID=UPI000F444406|nr:uncharacterized protein LOC113621156 isoform X2 [Lagenorhynchus obliquidens]
MHVNLEKVAGRAGADLRCRAWASPAPRAFVFVRDKGPSRRRSRTWRSCPAGHSAGRSGRSTQGSRSQEKWSSAVRGAARDQGSGAWPCASPAPSRSCRAPATSCGTWHRFALCPFRRVKERITWNPRLRPMAEGLCSRGHDSAAPAASGRVPPARAERPCLDWVHSRFLRPNMAGPRAPPRKCTPVVAFKRRSRTTRPGGRCLPCVWVVRQPRRSRSGTEMGASIRGQPYSTVSRALGLAGTPHSCPTLPSPARAHRRPRPGPSCRRQAHPWPRCGCTATPAECPEDCHRTQDSTGCLHGRGTQAPPPCAPRGPVAPFSPAVRCDPNTQAADVDLRRTQEMPLGAMMSLQAPRLTALWGEVVGCIVWGSALLWDNYTIYCLS